MHRCALGLALVTVPLVAIGCSSDRDLGRAIKRAIPEGSSRVNPCTGSTGLMEPPTRECVFFVPGDRTQVAVAVATSFARDGFDPSCESNGDLIEINGIRDRVAVSAEVVPTGYVAHGNVFAGYPVTPGGRAIPADAVAVKIAAERLDESTAPSRRAWARRGSPCTRRWVLRQGPLGCLDEWNGPGNLANRERVRRERPYNVVFGVVSAHGVPQPDCVFDVPASSAVDLVFVGKWRGDRLVWSRPQVDPAVSPVLAIESEACGTVGGKFVSQRPDGLCPGDRRPSGQPG